LCVNKWLWDHLPCCLTTLRPICSYGNFLLALVRLQANRTQNFGTLFFRNRPQLELMRILSDQKGKNSTLEITVLACSKGAEVYSVLWTIRTARPDLKVMMHALDISNEIIEFAKKGVYSLNTPEFVDIPIFGCMTEEDKLRMFDIVEGQAKIKSWIKEGIVWLHGDAADPKIAAALGSQDMVVANNFLCHMEPPEAERCLRNIVRLVKPGGYLFVAGMDLDVRTKVARDLGWQPIRDQIQDIHEGDAYLRVDWPWKYWGLEPFDKRRQDWEVRYASCFRVGEEI
ncbi:MAG: CheR family methyltransferase, partial [Syntrophobacteraceae bacterium]